MASFNFSTRQMSAKIVYYGPGLCGKTTSLKYIFHHTRAEARGKMVSLATETDRTLFFDLLPLEVGTVGGFHTRIQLYTVPGQVFYNSTRRLVLKGVDGIVFVADSQPAMLPSNVESFSNLEANLAELGIEIGDIPLVLQYNKRDLPGGCSKEELHEALNSNGWPEFETSAIDGTGIFEVLREISKLTLVSLKKQLEDGLPETLTPPGAEAETEPETAEAEEPVAEEQLAEEPSPDEPASDQPDLAAVPSMSDDEIEDRALDRLQGEEESLLADVTPTEGDGDAQELSIETESAEAVIDAAVEEAAEGATVTDDEDADAALAATDGDEPAGDAVAGTDGDFEEAEAGALSAESGESIEEPLGEVAADADSDELGEETQEPSGAQDESENIAAHAGTNGQRRLDRALSLALSGSDLDRAHRVLLDLQLRDERDRVLHQVRDIEWSLQDIDSLQDVLLSLKIELEREDA